VLSTWLAAACGDGAAPPQPFEPEPDVGVVIDERVTVEVDPAHPALETSDRHPQEGPVTVLGDGARLRVRGRARRLPARPDHVAVELFVENLGADAIRTLTASISSAAPDFGFVDFTTDPLATALDEDGEVHVGGIAPRGIATMTLGVAASGATRFEVELRGATTRRGPQSSGPVQISPDGAEVWVVVPDADQVVVIDVATDRRVASIGVPGGPSSVAITGDGGLVLVSSATANVVTIIDRAKRSIVRSLSEADGIGREPRAVVASADGLRAYVSSYVGDVVTVLERRSTLSFGVGARVRVGRRPLGVSLTGDGETLFASHFLPRGPLADNEGWVSVIDTRTGKLDHEAVLRDDGNRAESECLAQVFQRPAAELVFEGTATQLAGVFLAPGGALGWIPGLRFGPIPVWEVAPGAELPGITASRFAPAFVFYLDAREPARAQFKLAAGVLDPPDTNPALLDCLRIRQETEFTFAQAFADLPGERANTGAANPTGMSGLSETGVSRAIGFTRGGRRALVLSYVADELALVDAVTQHPAALGNLKLSGSNPIGIATTPDGRKAYVAYENSVFVSVLDLSALADLDDLPPPSFVPFRYRSGYGNANSLITRRTLFRDVAGLPERPPIAETGQVALVDGDPVSATRRRGRVLFTSSNPEKFPGLTASRQAACATCHPDGGHDGSGWGTMEGERRTLSLRGGIGGRGWLHQSGTHLDALEFVATVVAERLGGTGLAEGDAAALADYLAWGIPRLQGPTVDLELAAAGRIVFDEACRKCHVGDKLSSGNPDPADPLGGGAAAGPELYDVGSATSDMQLLLPRIFTETLPAPSNELYELVRGDRSLGPGDRVQEVLGFRPRPARDRGVFKAPSLVGVWDNVVFFHDGRFNSLAEVVAHLNAFLGLDLSAADQRAVIEYVKTL
jgi:YVTN family beta-propeller protein